MLAEVLHICLSGPLPPLHNKGFQNKLLLITSTGIYNVLYIYYLNKRNFWNLAPPTKITLKLPSFAFNIFII